MKRLTVGSTFTGVGGADLGFEWAGFDIKWQCELDAWKRSVLAAHYPGIPIYEDIVELADHVANSGNRLSGEILHKGQQDRRLSNNTPDTDSAITQRGFGDVDPVDVLIGGFPCQDLSVAGRRKGFSGERSVLAFEFLRVAESLQPRWIVLENVPGLLSSNRGRDFARLIDEVVGCGYGVAWRILDARYFGVPQRRRRVFIVARRADSQHDPRSASRLALRALFESGSGDTSSGWQAWTETTRSVGEGSGSGSVVCEPDPAGPLTRRYAKGVNTTMDDGAMIATLAKRDDLTNGGGQRECAAFRKSRRAKTVSDHETWVDADHANTLNAFDVGDTRTTHAVVEQASTLQARGKTGGPSVNAEMAAGGHLVPETFSVYPEGGNGADIAAAKVDRSPSLTKVKSERGIHIVEDAAQVIPFDTNFSNQASHGGSTSPTLDTRGTHGVAQAFTQNQRDEVRDLGTTAGALAAQPGMKQQTFLRERMTVRRLTPVECERLMGWPDGWTAPEGVKASDSKRYAACGDGIVAPVAFWIADRIRMIEEEEAS